jgi:hypothetical protein
VEKRMSIFRTDEKGDGFKIPTRRPSLIEIAFLVLIVVIIVVTVLLLTSTLNPTLIGLLGVIIGAVFGIIGTTLNTIYFEPYNRQKKLEDDAKRLRKALYNELMQQYFAVKHELILSLGPLDSVFKSAYATYKSALADPVTFYSMVPDAQGLDSAFSNFQTAHQNILQTDDKSLQMPHLKAIADYIDRLVERGYLDLDMIREVCDTTKRTERKAIEEFEIKIAERNVELSNGDPKKEK